MENRSWKCIVLVVLAIVVFLWLIKAPILSSYLTSRLKLPITIEHVSLWPKQAIFQNFRILNPKGFQNKNAFFAERGKMEYTIRSLFSTLCKIPQIELDSVVLNIEFHGEKSQNNWIDLAKKIRFEKHARQFLIDRLVLRKITVNVLGLNDSKFDRTQYFDEMHFEKVDSKKGFPTKDLIALIFQQAGMGQYIEELLDPETILEDGLNPLHIFGVQKKSP